METTATRERPILFSGPMVRAILEGRKTQTRRVVKPQPESGFAWPEQDATDAWQWASAPGDDDMAEYWPSYDKGLPCPYGRVGDRLWVKETTWYRDKDGVTAYCDGSLRTHPDALWSNHYVDSAGSPEGRIAFENENWKGYGFTRRPAQQMARRLCRLTLEITDVRVERLHDISEEDAIAEGSQIPIAQLPVKARQGALTERTAFANIWKAINGDASWKANPWVWKIAFRRLDNP